MNKKFFKTVCFSTVVAVSLGAVASLAGCGPKKTTYYIGSSGPLSGGAAVYGEAVYNGAMLAVNEINAAGGLDGVNFSFNMYDDEHKPDKVEAGYNSQFEAGMQVSLGCVTTKPCLEYKELSHNDNVFFMTPSATGDAVPSYDNGYQMCFSDSSQGSAIAEYIKAELSKDTTKIGVFYKSDDEYSAGIYNSFNTVMSALSPENQYDITVTSFSEGHDTDFSTQIATLKNAGCNFIFMPTYYQPAAIFMRQAKDELPANATYFGGDGLDGVDEELGDDFATLPQGISYISHFNSGATGGKAKEFIDAYKAAYNETPIQFAAGAYDCVYAIYNAMKFAKDNGTEIDVNISASDLCDILMDVFQDANFSFTGVTGTNMKWNANGTVDTSTKVATPYVIKAVGPVQG